MNGEKSPKFVYARPATPGIFRPSPEQKAMRRS